MAIGDMASGDMDSGDMDRGPAAAVTGKSFLLNARAATMVQRIVRSLRSTANDAAKADLRWNDAGPPRLARGMALAGRAGGHARRVRVPS
jgi:hypothetical protein